MPGPRIPGGDTPDALRQDLIEISEHPVLTEDEEKTLGKVVKNGQAAKVVVARSRTLSAAERKERLDAVEAGEKAETRLLNANLRLVVSIARPYHTDESHFLYLIQEGNIGLMHAVDNYDYEKSFRFATYSNFWIHQAIRRAMAD